MNEDTCGCCEGTKALTPVQITNRPGLNLLSYRVGTHASFLETMKARLSSYFLDVPQEGVNGNGQPGVARIYPLADLSTRSSEDPSIALLDAWATVGDVLSFYQERIANEGYLRTATERRSILELARLVGYALRPGVASTVYLAYTIDSNFKEDIVIPAGARVQSLPEGDEKPQSFETSENLGARFDWNNLQPRRSQPQTETSIKKGEDGKARVYLKGTSTNLKPNDPLLIDFGGDDQEFFRVESVIPDPAADHTKVILQTPPGGNESLAPKLITSHSLDTHLFPLNEFAASLSSAAALDASQLFEIAAKLAGNLLKAFAALAKAPASADRNEAIGNTLLDLKNLRDLLKSILESD